jgi:hypothetical protein
VLCLEALVFFELLLQAEHVADPHGKHRRRLTREWRKA